MSEEIWTSIDEARFQVLQARRDLVMSARRSIVRAAAVNLYRAANPGGPPISSIALDNLISSLIELAGPLCDALKPYDFKPTVGAPGLPMPAVADEKKHEEVVDATLPGYRFVREYENEAKQVLLRD